jgi:hypothetical protein
MSPRKKPIKNKFPIDLDFSFWKLQVERVKNKALFQIG